MNIRNERHWEIGSINDMVDMIVFVRSFEDGFLQGLDRWMMDRDSSLMMDQPVTSIAYWGWSRL